MQTVLNFSNAKSVRQSKYLLCLNFFASLDKQTKEANVIDSGVFRVKKYPYLRVDRFIASFRKEIDNQAAFVAWMDRMQALDQDARNYKIANLPNSAVASLDSVNDRAGIYSKVATCGDLLRSANFHNVNHQDQLRESVSVSDDYITLRRKGWNGLSSFMPAVPMGMRMRL